jgi:hypothetical protein
VEICPTILGRGPIFESQRHLNCDIELMKHRISDYGTILLLRSRTLSRVHTRSFLTAFDQDPVKINIRRTLPYIDPA